MKVLSYLLDADYNHKKKCFLYPSLLPMYGKILLRLIPLLSDLAIDESFYCTKGIPSSEFQCHFLALTNFAIKTIELKSLLSLGMKPKHLQFLIIHFASSIMTTEVVHLFPFYLQVWSSIHVYQIILRFFYRSQKTCPVKTFCIKQTKNTQKGSTSLIYLIFIQ